MALDWMQRGTSSNLLFDRIQCWPMTIRHLETVKERVSAVRVRIGNPVEDKNCPSAIVLTVH